MSQCKKQTKKHNVLQIGFVSKVASLHILIHIVYCLLL